jgi:DNA-binding NarL/FixJ family response regulator
VTRPRILIVDDHRVVAEGLVRLLGGAFEVVDTIDDGHLVLDAVSRLQPEVVILDLSLRNVSGLEAIHQLKQADLDVRIIVLTMHADPQLAVEALSAGASGFVLKESSGDELLEALRVVLNGGTYLASTLTKEIITLMVGPGPAQDADVELTTQQREVLRLIVRGLRAKEIAAALDLSTRSVEAIKYKTMQQLHVHSSAELIRYAVEHGIVPL